MNILTFTKKTVGTYIEKHQAKLFVLRFLYGKLLHFRWSKGVIEKEDEIEIIRKMFKTGAEICIDIGANVGRISYLLSSTKNFKRIYALEPQKETYQVLKYALSSHQEVMCYNIGISNQCTNTHIHIPIKETGLSTLEASLDSNFVNSDNRFPNKKPIKTVESLVHLQTLDYFCQLQSINKIDFIKCDVEGHELQVVMGAQQILQKIRPVWMIEIIPFVYDERIKQMNTFMKSHDYTMYVITKDGQKLCKAEDHNISNSRGYNYFFIPKEKNIPCVE